MLSNSSLMNLKTNKNSRKNKILRVRETNFDA